MIKLKGPLWLRQLFSLFFKYRFATFHSYCTILIRQIYWKSFLLDLQWHISHLSVLRDGNYPACQFEPIKLFKFFSISPVPVSWLLYPSEQHSIPAYLFNHCGTWLSRTGQSWRLVNRKKALIMGNFFPVSTLALQDMFSSLDNNLYVKQG